MGVVALVGVEERGGDAVGGVAGQGWGRVEVFDCCLFFFFTIQVRGVVGKVLGKVREDGLYLRMKKGNE